MRISTSQMQAQTIRTMLEQQSRLAATQDQIASGRRIQVPSDDPSGAKKILDLEEVLGATEQFQRNADAAEARLGLEENALSGVVNVLHRVRELAIRANNSHLSPADRESIAAEARERIDELLGIANTQDANGEFLFAGYQTGTRPFATAADGSVTYAGDQGQRQLQIGPERRVAVGDSGDDVFRRIRNGNGTFVVEHGANSGTGTIGPGTVTDSATWKAGQDVYTIEFVTNSAGELAYQITGATNGQIVPAPPAVAPDDAPAYQAGAAIDFQGIQVTIDGEPQVGDTFTVRPSGYQDIFSTVNDLIAALEAPAEDPAGKASFHNDMSRFLGDLDQALDHFVAIEARVGGRLNAIDSQRDINEDMLYRSEKLLSETADLDLAEAVTRLNRQRVALEAAQQAYVRVQGLSLFNFLR